MTDDKMPQDLVNQVKAQFCIMLILKHDFSLREIVELAHAIGCNPSFTMDKPK